MDKQYQVILAFTPTSPQFAAPFDEMEDAFAAYTDALEKLPSRVGVFVYVSADEGTTWNELLKRLPQGWQKAAKEAQAVAA